MKLVVVLVTAFGVAAATPGVVIAPGMSVEPLRDTPWRASWSSLSVGMNAAREQAFDAWSRAAWLAGLAVLIVAALTIITLSVARAMQRRAEVTVQRAVGASRRALLGTALREGSLVALASLGLGLVGTLIVAGMFDAPARVVITTPPLVLLGLGSVVIGGSLFHLGYARAKTPGVNSQRGGVPLIVPVAQFAFGLLGVLAGQQVATQVAVPRAAHLSRVAGTTVPLSWRDGDPASGLLAAVERARADSSVNLVSVSSPGTVLGLGHADAITTDCGRCYQGGIATPLRPAYATNHLVSADTFLAMNLHVIEGRALSDSDTRHAAPVAVVNRFLAEQEYENGGAVGRLVRVGGPDNWYRVVGIVDDPEVAGIGAAAVPQRRVFLSVWQHEPTELDVLVRSTSDDVSQILIRAGVPADAIGAAEPEARMYAQDARAARWFVSALFVEGWSALLLAAIGMLVVMRMCVDALLPELALRRAVGARRRHVWVQVAARAVGVAAGGTLIAVWLAPLTGARFGDLATLGVPVLAMVLATLAATLTPAWRAAGPAPAALPGFSDT